jgi:hypothetical protein
MNYYFPSLFNLYTPECKFLLDFNYSCPTDTSTTIIVPTIYLILQLSFTVFKRSSLSRTKVPHEVIRDLLSSESFSSESAFRNSESLIPTTGYIYIYFFFPVYLDYYTLQMDQFAMFQAFHASARSKLTSIKPHIVMDRISTFQALQISIRINQTNFNLLDPTGLSHIILINTEWKEASPTNLASSTRPNLSTLATCPITTINSATARTLQHCRAIGHLRGWSRITGGHSTGSPSPTPIFAMSNPLYISRSLGHSLGSSLDSSSNATASSSAPSSIPASFYGTGP